MNRTDQMTGVKAAPALDKDVSVFEASPAQRRLWLLSGLDQGNTDYIIAGALRLSGALKEDVLQAALNDCIARHESLRTGFTEIDGTPWQTIEAASQITITHSDLSMMPQDERLEHALRGAEAMAAQAFDLSQPPLMRVQLAKLGQHEWLLALAIHHIVCDGPSLALLVSDLAAAYSYRIDPAMPMAAEVPLQFADFAEWQREQLAQPESGQLLAACSQNLQGVPDLDLPTDHPRPKIRAAKGARISVALPQSLKKHVGGTARALGTTPFAVLLGAWGMTLASWSGQQDFAIGTPVTARNDPALAFTVGNFAETAALRFTLSEQSTIRSILEQVKISWRDSLAYAGVPFDLLVRALRRPQERSRTPLVQTIFSLNPAPAAIAMSGLAVQSVALRIGEAKTDLVLEVSETANGFQATFDYDSALFEAATIEGLAAVYRDLLGAALSRPEQTLEAVYAMIGAPLQSGSQAHSPGSADLGGTPAASEAAPVSEEILHAIQEIWQDLLQVSQITDDTNFFEIGGHSLLATKVASRLRKRLNIKLPMTALFDAPTFAELAAHVQMQSKLQAPVAAKPLPATPSASSVPLSSTQARLWFIQQLDAGNTAYVLSGAIRIEGPLDAGLLERTFGMLQVRHETLRTRFVDIDGKPAQIILPSAACAITLPVEELDVVAGINQAQMLDAMLRQEAMQPFALDQAPLIRARLINLAPRLHVLSISMHHIIADGWSLGVLWRDLIQIYRSLETGNAPRLPALPLQYRDYAQQDNVDQGGVLEQRDIAYWRGALADLPTLELSTDFPRPQLPSYQGRQYRFELPSHLVSVIDRLAQVAGASRFMVALTAFQVLLSRWSSQTDLALGVPVSGREQNDVQDLIGCFVNTLVIRADLSGTPDFLTLLTRIRTRCLAAFEHQALPFDRLLDALRPAHDLSRHPLFQVMFNYQNTDFHTIAWEGMRTEALDVDGGTTQFDLALYLEDADGSLHANFVYRSDLFMPATMERMASAFVAIIEAAEIYDHPVSKFDLLSAADRGTLAAWNDTTVDYGPAAPLDVLIAEQALRSPEAEAICAEDGTLSYAETMRRADALAARLQELGAGPGRTVAVQLARGIDLPLALLAVLRSGAAYLPLDHELPPERLAFMVEDAAPVALIALPGTTGWLNTEVAVIGPDAVALAPTAWRAPDSRTLADIAYVIYTSGSTGKPKGVMVPHAGIVNRLRWMQAEYCLQPQDRVLQKTSCSFDVSVWEFFWPLLTGATLVMARPGGHRDPEYIATTIAEQNISTLHFVPSMLEIFLAEAEPDHCASLRQVFTSGEALTPELRDRFFDFGSNARLHNLYGPTEASVDVTYWPCVPEERGGPVPIGRPVANTRIHVLNEFGQEMPIGVPGEICIGGVQVARGYLNRPELSAERFIRDPYANNADALLYRTGDLGRWRQEGWIEYIGRRDNQIKLRGHRIELGEIEAALRQHPAIRDAVVLVQGNSAESRHLVAFALMAGPVPGPVDNAALRQHLSGLLPAVMVPSFIHQREAFPLTSSGKIDRHALTALAGSLAKPGAAAGPQPASGTEQRIAAIWCDVLKQAIVDTNSNFFEAGGNSLLLVQVHARLRKEFEAAPTLIDLFRLPTVASLAAFIDNAGAPQTVTLDRPAGNDADNAIAIIGMAGRFPGSADVETLWRSLLAGASGIRQVSREEALQDGADPAQLDHPDYVPFAAPLDGIDQFDERFFGYSPADAAMLDPQGRLFLETAWEALESAGIDPSRDGGRIGVFAGATVSTYALAALSNNPLAGSELFRTLFSNDKDYLASRVSYKLGLTGPAIGVQTACSTSLVAVSLAIRSILSGESDTALAGGASITVPHRVGYVYEEGSIMSPDGHCRAFDSTAAGTVPGNGVGIVVLKRLSRALANGDPVRAVIRGIAINNDGAEKVGFSAPSVSGQETVLRDALRQAGLQAADIGYIETHGTGTRLGDEVELTALTRAFSNATDNADNTGTAANATPCLIGSLKSNLGHLDAAAGVAGLIKATLAVERGMIPPSLHVVQPNALLDSVASRFKVATTSTPWSDLQRPRRAGVSAFGIGGTNAHCIVEQAPPLPAGAADDASQLLVLSAHDADSLERYRGKLLSELEHNPQLDLASAAWTLQTGRRELPWRLAVSVAAATEARSALRNAALPTAPASSARPEIFFIFPGQGSQRAGMGASLFADEPQFRQTVEQCLAQLDTALSETIRATTFSVQPPADAEALLANTAVAQPALFILEYALARLLMSWGIQPAGMLGHSLGEIVAAAVADMLSLPAALQLVAERGRLMHASTAGAMLQVEASAAALAAILPAGLSIAAINAPELTVVAGPTDIVGQFAELLEQQGTAAQRLPTAYAFHSPLMADAAMAFGPHLSQLVLQAPTLPLLSNLSGDWMRAEEALDAGRWARQICQPVQFAAALAQLQRPAALLLEVGPGRTLSSFTRQAGLRAIQCMPKPAADSPGRQTLLDTVGALWQAGLTPDWTAIQGTVTPRRIALPTYPFARNRHWFAAPASVTAPQKNEPAAPHLALLDWHYAETALPTPVASVALLGAESPLSAALTDRFKLLGITVQSWQTPADVRQADLLIALTPDFQRLTWLAQRLAGGKTRLVVVTRNAQQADAATDRHAAMTAAAALCIGQELPELALRQIDLCEAAAAALNPRQVSALANECLANGPSQVVLRDGRRRVAVASPLAAPAMASASAWRTNGVTLITGGFGGVGMAFARHLAQSSQARLVLLGRQLPNEHDPRLQELRQLGAQVLPLAGDISQPDVAESTVRAALQHFGRLDSVIHAAGIAGNTAQRPILETDNVESAAILAAKCSGTSYLAAALQPLELDHVVLCSSLSTVLGGLGFAAYAAGNRWLEVCAEQQNRNGATPWLALAYDGWRFHAPAAVGAEPALSAADAIRLTEQALALGLVGRVLVAAGRLQTRLERWTSQSAEADPATDMADIAYLDTYDDPIEASVAKALAETLALPGIGPDDDFFALGGDSLIATRVIAKLRSATGLPLSVGLVLQAPTVRLLATAIAALQGGRSAAAGPAHDNEYEEGTL